MRDCLIEIGGVKNENNENWNISQWYCKCNNSYWS